MPLRLQSDPVVGSAAKGGHSSHGEGRRVGADRIGAIAHPVRANVAGSMASGNGGQGSSIHGFQLVTSGMASLTVCADGPASALPPSRTQACASDRAEQLVSRPLLPWQ